MGHDEVVVECDENGGEETKRWLEKAMIEGMDTVLNSTAEAHVPVGVEARIAKSWGRGQSSKDASRAVTHLFTSRTDLSRG